MQGAYSAPVTPLLPALGVGRSLLRWMCAPSSASRTLRVATKVPLEAGMWLWAYAPRPSPHSGVAAVHLLTHPARTRPRRSSVSPSFVSLSLLSLPLSTAPILHISLLATVTHLISHTIPPFFFPRLLTIDNVCGVRFCRDQVTVCLSRRGGGRHHYNNVVTSPPLPARLPPTRCSSRLAGTSRCLRA